MKFKSLEREVRHHVVCNLSYKILHFLIQEKILSETTTLICNTLVAALNRILTYERKIINVEYYTKNVIKELNKEKEISKIILKYGNWSIDKKGYYFWSTLYKYYKLNNIKIK